MIPTVIETKRIDGKPALRFEGSAAGAWRVAKSEIDAMLDHVKRELRVRRQMIYDAIGASDSSISRCRTGEMPVQEQWILRLSDYSGIPVDELRRVACIESPVRPHRNARYRASLPGRVFRDGVRG